MSETPMTSQPRRWLTIAIGTLALFIIAAYAVSRTHSFQAKYHRYRMEAAWNAMYAEPDTFQDGLVGYTVDHESEKYEFHRGQLVSLGVLRKVQHEFKHINTQSNESQDILRRLQVFGPQLIDFAAPYPSSPEPMKVTVWVDAAHVLEMTQFFKESDIPNYRKRFMTDEENRADN
ncbi:MAG: hypothetical protein KDA52_10625 [Planctomycetaceae bacterium]|nr:hypothetical protein [Planctomycetaceae bacterium]